MVSEVIWDLFSINMEKEYSEDITVGNEYTGYYHQILASLGDTLN